MGTHSFIKERNPNHWVLRYILLVLIILLSPCSKLLQNLLVTAKIKACLSLACIKSWKHRRGIAERFCSSFFFFFFSHLHSRCQLKQSQWRLSSAAEKAHIEAAVEATTLPVGFSLEWLEWPHSAARFSPKLFWPTLWSHPVIFSFIHSYMPALPLWVGDEGIYTRAQGSLGAYGAWLPQLYGFWHNVFLSKNLSETNSFGLYLKKYVVWEREGSERLKRAEYFIFRNSVLASYIFLLWKFKNSMLKRYLFSTYCISFVYMTV